MTTWHERAVQLGDLAEKARALVWMGVVGVAMVTVPPLIGWGAATMAAALLTNMNPKGALIIEVSVFLAGCGLFAMVIHGIDRFTRPIPTNDDSEDQ